LVLARKRLAKGLDAFNDETLGSFDGCWREGSVQDILAVFGFGISEEAEAGTVFVEALV
jgi:hypothetical protein